MWIAAAHAADWPSIDEPLRTGASSPDAVVAIGLEDYAFIPDVPFAQRDAAAFRAWALYTRGVPADRVQSLNAGSREEILDAVRRGGRQVGPDGALWLYYAGHGAASPTDGARMLLGDDARPTNFEARGVTIDALREAAGVPVRMVLDTCYTGAGRGGEELVPGGRFAIPARAVQVPSGSEWTAAGPNEISRPFDPAKHGAFTYFSVGALRGWADGAVDGRRDGQVTAAEADRYVAGALSAAGVRNQTPGWYGGTDVVLSRNATEEGPDLAAGAPAPTTATATVTVGSQSFGDLGSKIGARKEAEAAIRRSATQDWAALYEILKLDPRSPEAKRGLELFVAKYAAASVDVAGERATVSTPELDLAKRLQSRLNQDREYEYEGSFDIKQYRKPGIESRRRARLQGLLVDVYGTGGVGKPFTESAARFPLSVGLGIGGSFDGWSLPGVGVSYTGIPGANTPGNTIANVSWGAYKHDVALLADVVVGGMPRLGDATPGVWHAALGVRHYGGRGFLGEIGGRLELLVPQDVDTGDAYPTLALELFGGFGLGELR